MTQPTLRPFTTLSRIEALTARGSLLQAGQGGPEDVVQFLVEVEALEPDVIALCADDHRPADLSGPALGASGWDALADAASRLAYLFGLRWHSLPPDVLR